MEVTAVNQYNNYKPQFQGNLLKKGRYALEYVDCVCQKDYPPPEVYRQLLPFNLESAKAPFETLMIPSINPTEDLEVAYELYRKDFKEYHNFLSYKKFKNSLYYENATVFILGSGKENYGFYSLAMKDNNTLYVADIDMNPKYRNTRLGKDIIMTCWDNINKIADENNCSKISLHVDAGKKHLVNLYEKLGFEVQKTEKYPTGQKAYYMEKTRFTDK